MDIVTDFPDCFKQFPRNPIDFEDGIVLFDNASNTFYQFMFGTGDNLWDEDIENGYDDYIMYDAYSADGSRSIEEIKKDIRNGIYLDEIDGLAEEDGGQMLVKRSDYSNSGDIRMYLENALEMANYGVADLKDLYKGIEFVSLMD